MEPLYLAAALLRHPHATAFSALPDAPLVAEPERPARAARSRVRVAGGLHRLADAIAPTAPAPRRAYAGR